jgi:hypothetical protein
MWYFQERDFDKHAQYYGDEPKSQELLREDKHLREFFEVSRLYFLFFCNERIIYFRLVQSVKSYSSIPSVYFFAFW